MKSVQCQTKNVGVRGIGLDPLAEDAVFAETVSNDLIKFSANSWSAPMMQGLLGSEMMTSHFSGLRLRIRKASPLSAFNRESMDIFLI